MCEDCKYLENENDNDRKNPCNTCIKWIEGEKEFTNYESKYFCDNCC